MYAVCAVLLTTVGAQEVEKVSWSPIIEVHDLLGLAIKDCAIKLIPFGEVQE